MIPKKMEFVLLNILKLESSNLKHFSNRYELFKFHFIFQNSQVLLFGPAHRSAQAGSQAGTVAEAAGLRAGPYRALGRASNGTSRPAGRLRPTPRPGALERAVTPAVTDGKMTGD